MYCVSVQIASIIFVLSFCNLHLYIPTTPSPHPTPHTHTHHTQAQRVHSMFPHTPLEAITLDLADTHSVSLTVERIINNVIYIPEQDRPSGELTPSQPHTHTGTQCTLPNTPLPTASPLSCSEPHTLTHITPPTTTEKTCGPTHTTSTVRKRNVNQDTGTKDTPSTDAVRVQDTGTKDTPSTDAVRVQDTGTKDTPSTDAVRVARPIRTGAADDAPAQCVVTTVPARVKVRKMEPFASLVERKEQLLERARR